jgi:hypothetical protein
MRGDRGHVGLPDGVSGDTVVCHQVGRAGGEPAGRLLPTRAVQSEAEAGGWPPGCAQPDARPEREPATQGRRVASASITLVFNLAYAEW